MPTTSSSSHDPAATRPPATSPRATCLCSPTNHPGSFRCSRHRAARRAPGRGEPRSGGGGSGRATAKARSVRAHLMRIVSPSCRDLRRRHDFQPRPSRLCCMHK